MTGTEYQKLAMKTRAIPEDDKTSMMKHAVFGLNAEAGEVAELIEKTYYDEELNIEHLKKELGDCLWMIAEMCCAMDCTMDAIDYTNEINPLSTLIENTAFTAINDVDVYQERINSIKLMNGVYSLNSRAGKIAGIFQKEYQGHSISFDNIKSELIVCMRMINEIAKSIGTNLDEIKIMNIEKLAARFPEQHFDTNLDIHRKEGDI